MRLLRDTGPPDSSQLLWTEAHDRFEAGEAALFIDAMTELTLMRRRRAARRGDRGRPRPIRAEGDSPPGLYGPVFMIPAATGTSRPRGSLVRARSRRSRSAPTH
jgi:hypothetical protein